VNKSLEGKLRSLILIPILSQVYCDKKSYAWQNEFCAFNKISSCDSLGRDIVLRSGNVASRILPILVHKLDPEDQSLIESELKTKLRFIDFTFQSPGVNRALRKEDKRHENANQIIYHDQLNKLANAIKEIITALQNPGKVKPADTKAQEMSVGHEEKFEKSLAVLPFANLSLDASQEYFADGISENILMELSGMPEFKVISRTSVMRFKTTNKTAPEIAEELGVLRVPGLLLFEDRESEHTPVQKPEQSFSKYLDRSL
jgi:hypothetical protein